MKVKVFNFGKIDFKKLFTFFGPAYLIGIGYMDPGNWATDLAGGSGFEYQLIWVLALSNLLALFLQNLSTRFGIVTGLDLASASRMYYPFGINFLLYILAEIAVIACDLAEIIGMAIGLKLLFGIPLLWGIYITFADTLLVLLLVGKKVRRLEIFIISMISIISFSFIIELFLIKIHLAPIMRGFIPREIHGEALFISLGIIGATVMPHNLYLHSFLVTHNHKKGNENENKKSTWFALIDTALALNIAFFVNLSILILSAAAFYRGGYYQVAELEDAHRLLKQLLGSVSSTLFGIALLASGQSATITGTLAGQIIMEGYLDIKLKPWIRRLITRSLALIPATLTLQYAHVKSLNSLLIISQIVLSLQLCFAIVPLIHFNSNKKWMGNLVLPMGGKITAWLIFVFLVIINGRYLYTEISIAFMGSSGFFSMPGLLLGLGSLMALVLLVILVLEPYLTISKNRHKLISEYRPLTEEVNLIP